MTSYQAQEIIQAFHTQQSLHGMAQRRQASRHGGSASKEKEICVNACPLDCLALPQFQSNRRTAWAKI